MHTETAGGAVALFERAGGVTRENFNGTVFCLHLCSCQTLYVVSSFHSTNSLWTCLLCIKTVALSPFLSNRLELVFYCFLFVYGSVLVKLNPVTILNA